MRSRLCRGGVVALTLVLANGCSIPSPESLRLEPVPFSSLPDWTGDRHAGVLPALRRSCAVRARRKVAGDARFGTADAWVAACQAAGILAAADDAAARRYFETWFRPFKVVGPDGDRGLFTGYFEPELAGAPLKTKDFAVPLYGRPADLVTVRLADFRAKSAYDRIAGRVIDGVLKPYFTRAEIAAGALAGRGLELFWVADPIEAFFLHIQGSGQVRLPDGTRVRLGYAAANGHVYTAIGRALVHRGALVREQVSLQSIRAWLRANPSEAPAILARNESYVFFHVVKGDGPLGAQGVPLTPGRSIAVDPRLVPLGLPMWIDTPHPLPDQMPLRRLVVTQDTGGAIRGAVRADVFWGSGVKAEAPAGRMRSDGRYFALVPRTLPVTAAR